MAARRSTRQVDDEVPEEPAEDAIETEEFDEADIDEDALDEEELEDPFDDEEQLDDELADEPDEELSTSPVDEDPELETEPAVVPPPDATFDDEGGDTDEGIVAAVTGEDEDDAEIEGLRDGEFVCRSCYMAKRDTQLADPEHLLCRDCA